MISWICRESTTSPSFCISSAEASRVCWASSLRLAIRSSTVSPPMIERRWPWKTSLTMSCICEDTRPPSMSWSCRKRVVAFVIETGSSPTLNSATPRTPTGIFWESTPSTSSSALSACSERYCARCSAGMTNAPPPVTILNVRPAVDAPEAPRPGTRGAWAPGGGRAGGAGAGGGGRRGGGGPPPQDLEQHGDHDDDGGHRDGGDQQGV